MLIKPLLYIYVLKQFALNNLVVTLVARRHRLSLTMQSEYVVAWNETEKNAQTAWLACRFKKERNVQLADLESRVSLPYYFAMTAEIVLLILVVIIMIMMMRKQHKKTHYSPIIYLLLHYLHCLAILLIMSTCVSQSTCLIAPLATLAILFVSKNHHPRYLEGHCSCQMKPEETFWNTLVYKECLT